MTSRSGSLLVSGALAAVLGLSGCVTEPATAPAATPESTPSPTKSVDMMERVGTADWECGQLSALNGILTRSQWEHTHNQIDDAQYATRLASIQDAWVYVVVGDSTVTSSIRALSQAAKNGVGSDNTAFTSATDDAIQACDAAGSIVAVGALPQMGG